MSSTDSSNLNDDAMDMAIEVSLLNRGNRDDRAKSWDLWQNLIGYVGFDRAIELREQAADTINILTP